MHWEKLKEIVASVLGVAESELSPEFSIETCERWDSLTHMELITSIEREYEIELTMDDIVEMTSIQKMAERLEEAL